MDNQQQYSLVHSAHNSFLQDPIQTSQFKIGLFEIGDLNSCIYSFTCCRCAVAQSRLFLEDSSYIFNIFFTPLAPYRWMVRSAYGIGNNDEWLEDCVLSTFCSCCVINQIYQTTKAFGNPTMDGGRTMNALEKSIGLPCVLGCMFSNICFAHHAMRYQFRLKNESKSAAEDECLMYLSFCAFNCVASMCAPIAQCLPCMDCLVTSAYVMRILYGKFSSVISHIIYKR